MTTTIIHYPYGVEWEQEKGDYDRAAALEKQMNQGKEFKMADLQLSAQEKFNKAIEKYNIAEKIFSAIISIVLILFCHNNICIFMAQTLFNRNQT